MADIFSVYGTLESDKSNHTGGFAKIQCRYQTYKLLMQSCVPAHRRAFLMCDWYQGFNPPAWQGIRFAGPEIGIFFISIHNFSLDNPERVIYD